MKKESEYSQNIILVMGLPGSGKTHFCTNLLKLFSDVDYFNADAVRESNNDWDFSIEGRIRQAKRMKSFADSCSNTVIIDMVCPLPEMREIINPNTIFFIDRIKKSIYENTNNIFQPPTISECSNLFVIV